MRRSTASREAGMRNHVPLFVRRGLGKLHYAKRSHVATARCAAWVLMESGHVFYLFNSK